MKRIVAVNEQGLPVGQFHHRAKLSDHEIDLIRDLHDEGLTYIVLAAKFEVSKSCIAGICQCRRRAQTPERYKVVQEHEAPRSRRIDQPNGH